MSRRFFIHVILTVLIAMSVSSVYYYWVCCGLRHTKEFYPGRLNCILYDTTAYDVVFVGSSRAASLIDPLVFDSVSHLKSYNAGMEGASINAISLFTKKFINRHHPKYVFVNIDNYTLERDSYSLFQFPKYYPHLSDTDIATWWKLKPQLLFGKYAPCLAITYMDDFLKGMAFNEFLGCYPFDDLTSLHKGFSPYDSIYAYGGTSNDLGLSFMYDTANFKKLDALCQLCRDQHCEIIFTMAPMYAIHEVKSENVIIFYDRLRTIEAKYHIREFNHYTDRSFKKELFFNRTHLNIKGALIYSHMLADSFTAMYQSKPAN